MPNNWKTYKLDQICNRITDGSHSSPKENISGVRQIATVKDMNDFGFNLEQCKKISDKDFENLKNQDCVPEKGDVLFSKDGTIGKVLLFDFDYKIGILSSIAIFRPKKELINSRFLSYYLKEESNNNYIRDNYRSGSAIPRIILRDFKKYELKIPENLKEQQSIASILSAIDDKIENNLAINKTLEEMAMALYKHWFVDFGPFQDGEFVESELGQIPEGWEVKSVYDIATYVNGAAFKPSELIDDGKYVIKISELNGGITKNTGRSIKEVKTEQIINDGSVLFSWSATLDIFLWDKGEALLNQHIFNVLPNNTLSKEVLYFLLKNIISYFKAIAADRATTMGHIKITHLKETFIAIPNKEMQIEINNQLIPLFNQILENLIENQTLTQLRDTLLPKLISGEVRLKEFKENLEV